MSLNNNDLYKKHDQLVQLKKETYEKIYNRCVNTIKLTSNAGELVCLFQIPEVVFGLSYPKINIVSCANYIMNKLTKANKHVKTNFYEPNIIFIDWRRESDMHSSKAYMPVKKNLSTTTNNRSDSSRSEIKSPNSSSILSLNSSSSNKHKRH